MIIYGEQTGDYEPHPSFWVIAYWVFILKYFWNILNKSFLKILKNLEIIITLLCMVYIKNLLKLCHFQKNSNPFINLSLA
jgi:hypothetical protein